jgi:hypothetical protein
VPSYDSKDWSVPDSPPHSSKEASVSDKQSKDANDLSLTDRDVSLSKSFSDNLKDASVGHSTGSQNVKKDSQNKTPFYYKRQMMQNGSFYSTKMRVLSDSPLQNQTDKMSTGTKEPKTDKQISHVDGLSPKSKDQPSKKGKPINGLPGGQ